MPRLSSAAILAATPNAHLAPFERLLLRLQISLNDFPRVTHLAVSFGSI
jgi:hypothetical protein